jgi:hypothetical protein
MARLRVQGDAASLDRYAVGSIRSLENPPS